MVDKIKKKRNRNTCELFTDSVLALIEYTRRFSCSCRENLHFRNFSNLLIFENQEVSLTFSSRTSSTTCLKRLLSQPKRASTRAPAFKPFFSLHQDLKGFTLERFYSSRRINKQSISVAAHRLPTPPGCSAPRSPRPSATAPAPPPPDGSSGRRRPSAAAAGLQREIKDHICTSKLRSGDQRSPPKIKDHAHPSSRSRDSPAPAEPPSPAAACAPQRAGCSSGTIFSYLRNNVELRKLSRKPLLYIKSLESPRSRKMREHLKRREHSPRSLLFLTFSCSTSRVTTFSCTSALLPTEWLARAVKRCGGTRTP